MSDLEKLDLENEELELEDSVCSAEFSEGCIVIVEDQK